MLYLLCETGLVLIIFISPSVTLGVKAVPFLTVWSISLDMLIEKFYADYIACFLLSKNNVLAKSISGYEQANSGNFNNIISYQI